MSGLGDVQGRQKTDTREEPQQSEREVREDEDEDEEAVTPPSL